MYFFLDLDTWMNTICTNYFNKVLIVEGDRLNAGIIKIVQYFDTTTPRLQKTG